jgi:hypothetical protein
MDQDKVNMIILALLAVNIILGLICIFKKGASEEEFRSAFNAVATTRSPTMAAPTMAAPASRSATTRAPTMAPTMAPASKTVAFSGRR